MRLFTPGESPPRRHAHLNLCRAPSRLGSWLTKACVQVLPITGAGLSLFSAPTMRIPIGAKRRHRHSRRTRPVHRRLLHRLDLGDERAAHRSSGT